MRLESMNLDLKLPVVSIRGTWRFDARERQAAWEVYVELVTRISVVRLDPEGGSLREALESFHSLFISTREVLRKYGPDVAKPKGGGDISFGYLALWMLNGVLRPLLTDWHPRLLDHEVRKDPSVSAIAHERAWSEAEALRRAIEDARSTLTSYARIFEKVAGIPSLITE